MQPSKKRIVVSGVNIISLGPLAVFKDALHSLAADFGHDYEIIALVHDRSLFDIPHIQFIDFPHIKSSWLSRIRFEYWTCRRLSRQLHAFLWFAMHDMSPFVTAQRQAVYCHNAVSVNEFRWNEIKHDYKLGAFTLFYRFLYGIHIKANRFVVVQQDWFRQHFQQHYGIQNVVVARPSVDKHSLPPNVPRAPGQPYRFFYASYPRPFKGMGLILQSARDLWNSGVRDFQIGLTTDGTETRYARMLKQRFGDLPMVQWLGLLPRSEVLEHYAKADCLIFPSRLESWGMPITEFQATGKPIITVDLPYARETVGDYPAAAFFNLDRPAELTTLMQGAIAGQPVFHPATAQPVPAPFARNWSELWRILLAP